MSEHTNQPLRDKAGKEESQEGLSEGMAFDRNPTLA